MKATETVEGILRPLVEATVLCPECRGSGEVVFVEPARTLGHPCPKSVLDPRFEALRKRAITHEDRHHNVYYALYWLGGIDASMGAIVRAMGACGLTVTLYLFDDGTWGATIRGKLIPGGVWDSPGWEATPEEAAARGFVDVWAESQEGN